MLLEVIAARIGYHYKRLLCSFYDFFSLNFLMGEGGDLVDLGSMSQTTMAMGDATG